jgi:hypothetical protein
MRIESADVQAWCEPTKLTVGVLDDAFDAQIESQIISTLEAGFDVTSWVDPTTTPEIVKSVIAMRYASLLYDRQYSEDSEESNAWAARLDMMASDLIDGMLSGSVTIDGYLTAQDHSDPVGFPTDASSIPQRSQLNAQWSPNNVYGDPASSPPMFSVGMKF